MLSSVLSIPGIQILRIFQIRYKYAVSGFNLIGKIYFFKTETFASSILQPVLVNRIISLNGRYKIRFLPV